MEGPRRMWTAGSRFGPPFHCSLREAPWAPGRRRSRGARPRPQPPAESEGSPGRGTGSEGRGDCRPSPAVCVERGGGLG